MTFDDLEFHPHDDPEWKASSGALEIGTTITQVVENHGSAPDRFDMIVIDFPTGIREHEGMTEQGVTELLTKLTQETDNG